MTIDQRQGFWDRRFQEKGHTGYSDPLLHGYDQPIRLATVARAIRRHFPGELEGRRALDIGCGTGDFIRLHRSLGAECVGVDISPLVIEGTRERFRDDPGVSLHAGTIVDAELPPEGFDVITSVTVLQHVLDNAELERSLAALGATLKPDGIMILLELMPPWEEEVEHRSAEGIPYIVERPPAVWMEAIRRAGLRVVDEPSFPQLGIACLRGLAGVVRFLNRSRAPVAVPTAPKSTGGGEGVGEKEAAETSSGRSPLRSLRSLAGRTLRRGILMAAYPFDYLVPLPLTPDRFQHYRIYVLGR